MAPHWLIALTARRPRSQPNPSFHGVFRVILFLRSSDVAIDARLGRYAAALRCADVPHLALFWRRDRRAAPPLSMPARIWRAPLALRHRLLTGVYLLLFNLFLLGQLWLRRHGVTLVHAVDLDTALAAWLIGRLTGVPYVYDIYDHYADSRGLSGWRLRLVEWLDATVCRDAAAVILADSARVAQHRGLDLSHAFIVENVPDLGSGAAASPPPDAAAQQPLRIGYLGTLEAEHRGLEAMLDLAAQDAALDLHIGGSGVLQPLVERMAARHANIHFHGPMAHGDGLAMLARCDLILGLYRLTNRNHRFASPNKYFEHLALGRPLLTSAGTPPGERVARHGTGWVVGDERASLRAALDDAAADRAAVQARGAAARALWNVRYADYVVTRIGRDYVALVAAVARDGAGAASSPASAAVRID